MNTNTTTRTEGQQPGPCITGSQALLESFLREGVDTLFGYPGGAIIPVYDALFDYRDRLRHILVRHEQGAVHAAQGYARVSGRVGVCLVTSGPGATNTVTGLADALMDSTPLVLVTGQVGSSLLGTDAFQETNFVGITQAVTKWNCQVKRTEDIPGAIAKAFYIARSGRPGPVVVDITKDARYAILDEIMLKAIPQPREDVSDWAPKMTTMHINPDKIREVIGKGGSVIQNIVAESGAKVDIEDDGTVTIAAVKATDADKAKKMIEAIVKEPEPGEIYYGKVVRLMNFGAFVNLLPGKDGMVHISKMADHRIEKVEDAVKEGDMVWVKVMEIDDKGRVNLSMKDVKPEEKIL